MFTVVMPTVREIKDMSHIFKSSHPEAELIIVDSRYSEERKKNLEKIEHKYKKLVYMPPKKQDDSYSYNYDMVSATNTGIMFSEEPWVFWTGDNWEYAPDYWDKLIEDVDFFTKLLGNTRFMIRPIELEPWNGDKKWESYIPSKRRYFVLPSKPFGDKNGNRDTMPICTCGLAATHIESWYELNGFDERYDMGNGWMDNDLFDRMYMAKIKMIFDQECMTFRHPHQQIANPQQRKPCEAYYWNTRKEIQEGRIAAPNTYDLKEKHQEHLKEKDKWVIS